MPLAHETGNIPGPINDHREESRNVPAQHAHIQHVGISDGGKLAPKCHLAGLPIGETDRRSAGTACTTPPKPPRR